VQCNISLPKPFVKGIVALQKNSKKTVNLSLTLYLPCPAIIGGPSHAKAARGLLHLYTRRMMRGGGAGAE
jgi:hypothetical protein